MSDLISRTDAIRAIDGTGLTKEEKDTAVRAFEWIPEADCDKCHYKHIWMIQRMNGTGYLGHGGATA